MKEVLSNKEELKNVLIKMIKKGGMRHKKENKQVDKEEKK